MNDKNNILEELQGLLITLKTKQKQTIFKAEVSPYVGNSRYLDEIYSEGYWQGSILHVEKCIEIIKEYLA